MHSVRNPVKTEIVINKSRFLGSLFRVTDPAMAEEYLNKERQEHPDANHHCYAYMIGDFATFQKASDDGEPNQTAGIPILEVLKKNQLTDVLVIVTRYFGGIKLGAGGLIRAYAKTAAALIEQAERVEKQTIDTYLIVTDYHLSSLIERTLRENALDFRPLYAGDVTFEFDIPRPEAKRIISHITDLTSAKAIPILVKSETRY